MQLGVVFVCLLFGVGEVGGWAGGQDGIGQKESPRQLPGVRGRVLYQDMRRVPYPEPRPDLVWFGGCAAPAFVFNFAASGVLCVLCVANQQRHRQIHLTNSRATSGKFLGTIWLNFLFSGGARFWLVGYLPLGVLCLKAFLF